MAFMMLNLCHKNYIASCPVEQLHATGGEIRKIVVKDLYIPNLFFLKYCSLQ